MVLDGEGRKMSKSLGNTIDPNKVIKQKGADIIRLWVSSVDSQSDVRVSMDIINQVSEVYRKIRNTIRFLLANVGDFDPKEHTVSYDELRPVDQYMTNRLYQMTEKVIHAYDKYDFPTVYKTINNFCITDLSNFYLDFAKDVVYIESEDAYERRAMQSVFYEAAVVLAKLLTPVLPHTTEEIWSYLYEKEEYVQLSEMPSVRTFDNGEEILEQWQEFMKIRENILKALEVARDAKEIGKSFEAKVTLYPNDIKRELLQNMNTNLRQVLIVSDLEIEDLSESPEEALEFEGISILVEHKHGETCERCRIISEEVGTFEEAPTLCHRCYSIVKEHFPEALETSEE